MTAGFQLDSPVIWDDCFPDLSVCVSFFSVLQSHRWLRGWVGPMLSNGTSGSRILWCWVIGYPCRAHWYGTVHTYWEPLGQVWDNKQESNTCSHMQGRTLSVLHQGEEEHISKSTGPEPAICRCLWSSWCHDTGGILPVLLHLINIVFFFFTLFE